MLTELIIIAVYFVMLMVPVATVVVFFRLDSQDKLGALSGFDSYFLPEEKRPEPPKLLPPAHRHTTSRCDENPEQ